MSIAVEPGTSSDELTIVGNKARRVLHERGIYVRMIDRFSPFEMRAAYDAYVDSMDAIDAGDPLLSWTQFVETEIAHVALFRAATMQCECIFGIELCSAMPLVVAGPLQSRQWWTNWLYFAMDNEAPRGVLRRCGSTIVEISHDIAKRWCGKHGKTPVLMLRGRPGWARVLKSLAIERDEWGWITADQERFRHGFQ